MQAQASAPPVQPVAQTSANALITMDHVTKTFGSQNAVTDITWQIEPGEIFGIVGPSGCGKTTAVRLMTGVYIPTSGTVTLLGKNPAAFTARDREQLGYMPQLFVLYPNLNVMENMRFAASMYGVSPFKRRKRIDELINFVELDKARKTQAVNISGGMQRRLQLAAALVHEPALLFADEPTAGIDPVLRGRFWDQFKELKAQGKSLVVTTQYVSEVAYCDRVAVMRNGKLLMVDTPDNLRRRALGSDIISIRVDPEDVRNTLKILSHHPLVLNVERLRNAPFGSLAIYVEQANTAMADIISSLAQDSTIDMRHVEEYKPPFDDVFIILMEKIEREEQAASAGAAQHG